MEEEKIREDKLKNIENGLKDIMDVDYVSSLVEKNEIEFEYKNMKYKVSRPSFRCKQDVNEKKMVKYIELLKMKTSSGEFQYKTEEDLIKLYKERGKDIEEINNRIDNLDKQKNDYMFKLGKLLKEGKTSDELEVMKKEINVIYDEQKQLVMEKSMLLESSLESQINVYVYTYMGYICTEKYIDDKWIKSWNTYEEFLEEDEYLVNKVVFYISLLSRSQIPEL